MTNGSERRDTVPEGGEDELWEGGRRDGGKLEDSCSYMQSMWITDGEEQVLQIETKGILFPIDKGRITGSMQSNRETSDTEHHRRALLLGERR